MLRSKLIRCFYYFKVPAESSKCSVQESMGEKGSACSACLQQVGRTFVLPQYLGNLTLSHRVIPSI